MEEPFPIRYIKGKIEHLGREVKALHMRKEYWENLLRTAEKNFSGDKKAK